MTRFVFPVPRCPTLLLFLVCAGAWLRAVAAPPVIVQRPSTVRFTLGHSLTFSVVAESALPVTYQWFHNKQAIAGATNSALIIASGAVEHIGDYSVEVSNADGTVSSLPDDDSRALMVGAFVVEAEDFNFGGGKTLPGANVMPLAESYFAGQDGLPGIDFHLVSQSSPDPLDFGNAYRNGWSRFGVVMGEPPTAPEPLGNVDIIPVTAAANLTRPDYTMIQNYKVGWNDPGEWYQYTREFDPAGIWTFGAVALVARDGLRTNRFSAVLELVTGDPTQTNATTQVLGEIKGDGTGGWDSFDYLPFRVPGGTGGASFPLKGKVTVRYRVTEGDADLDALLFYPIIHEDSFCPCIDPLSSKWQSVIVDPTTRTITASPTSEDFKFLRVIGAVIERVRLEGDRLIVHYH
jgi:hypothetical protein